ncbi:hypothetical protein [Hoeflea sp. 108]|uniref:hypothetical protein n=1 Tax=Hoeflea sp. 108 TaxID=1116369 RepID=UPI0003622FBC|nr:hypothetical protein [Hoeflea sp. 108]
MFIIASSGRCGTEAICEGLSRYSDHVVRHEPTPTLLEEAWLKDRGQNYKTDAFHERMKGFATSGRYGESFRAPNLLHDIREVAAQTRFLIVVRKPLEYVLSAHSKRVLSKGNYWDQYRLLPPGNEEFALAMRIALHWRTVNEYLVKFAEETSCPVVLHQDWANLLVSLPQFLGVTITDPISLKAYWSTRPNASISNAVPDGFAAETISNITNDVWRRAVHCSQREASRKLVDLPR